MAKAIWTIQNEATDAEGFLLEGEALIQAEIAHLTNWGAPDADKITNATVETIDRDESTITASITDALYQWLLDEDMLIDVNYED